MVLDPFNSVQFCECLLSFYFRVLLEFDTKKGLNFLDGQFQLMLLLA